MNEDRVEELLRELGRQRAQPSVELMERVRRRGRADRLLAVVTALSLTLSALWLVPLALLWWLPGLDWPGLAAQSSDLCRDLHRGQRAHDPGAGGPGTGGPADAGVGKQTECDMEV